MPIYEFTCRDCGERFDRLQRSADADPACPSCGSSGVRRLISVVAGLSGGGRDSGASAGCACGGRCACAN